MKKCKLVKDEEQNMKGIYWELAVCLCRYVQHKEIEGVMDPN